MIQILSALTVCLVAAAATMMESSDGSGMSSSGHLGMSSNKDMSSSGMSKDSQTDVDMSRVSSDGNHYNWNGESTVRVNADVSTYKASMGNKDTDHFMCNGDGYSGKTWQVIVGGTGLLTFQPQTLNAAKGDRVQFNFMSTNHTLTQSNFSAPCSKMDGIDSGFMPNPNNMMPPPSMTIQVSSTNPAWFYCKQKNHCGKGMTFSLNPCPDKTDAAFHAAALASGAAAAAMAMAMPMSSTMAMPAAASSMPPPASTTAMMAPPAPAPAPVSASPPTTNGLTTGSADGQCGCSCLCNSNAFPVGVGMGMMGGMPGMMASM